MPAVDGLSSGINTTQMINAFIAAERAPQQRLTLTKADLSKEVSALSKLQTAYKDALSAIEKLSGTSAWSFSTATSSSEGVTATVTGSPEPTSLSFTVDALATGESIYSTDTVTESSVVATAGTYAGMTASEFVSAVNSDEALNTSASLLQVSPGVFRIHLSSTETGSLASVGLDTSTLDGLASGFTELTPAADAQITLQGVNPLSITSSTNTFTGLTPGVDIEVNQVSTSTVKLTVADDPDALADSVASAMEAAIAALNKVDELTKVTASSRADLAGSFQARRSETSLRSDFTSVVGSSSLALPSAAGVEVNSEGVVSFNKEKFKEAFAADPVETKKIFTSASSDGIFDRLEAEFNAATSSTTGYLSTSEDALEDRIRDLDDQIAAWDIRLESRRATYQSMFTRLEASLAEMQQQSAWLSSQIASLPTSFGGIS